MGESASEILRRLLNFPQHNLDHENLNTPAVKQETPVHTEEKPMPKTVSVHEDDETPILVTTKKQSDESIQHVVSKVKSLLDSAEFQQETKAVVRFLNLLRVLYRSNPESFAQATESLQGRTRVYFARDEGTLLMAGTHTKPKQIPDTPYWVITNTNSNRKMLMLDSAMQSMHLPMHLIDEVRPYFVTP
ncbi:replication initiation negative regulator SeqA [Pasteurella sp. PK-2025]|uniref:replication initiation negative regulator SeqA n=1 Tax=Pasteurella sp. PK-2025 TaxID=3413133 RepID=UPI003C7072AB